MGKTLNRSFSAFAGTRRIARGDLREAALASRAILDRDPWAQVLIFDDHTSRLVELDLRGSPDDVVRRVDGLAKAEAEQREISQEDGERRQPGRPKLGVVAREVTLLPRHWEWLASQPGGASAAMRRLVDQARAANQSKDRRRLALDAAYRFMSAMAGNEAGFEEATRALFALKPERFHEMIEAWPEDVRDHAKMLAERAFAG